MKLNINGFQHYDTQHNNIQLNDTQHKGLICDTLHTWTLGINDTQHNNTANTDCHYTECHNLCLIMLSIILLQVIMLNGVAPLFRLGCYRESPSLSQAILCSKICPSKQIFMNKMAELTNVLANTGRTF